MNTTKRVPVKVYFEATNEVLKRLEHVASVTSLSLSSVASMAMKHGIDKVEDMLSNVFPEVKNATIIQTRKAKSKKSSK